MAGSDEDEELRHRRLVQQVLVRVLALQDDAAVFLIWEKKEIFELIGGAWGHSTMGSNLASHPALLGSNLTVSSKLIIIMMLTSLSTADCLLFIAYKFVKFPQWRIKGAEQRRPLRSQI